MDKRRWLILLGIIIILSLIAFLASRDEPNSSSQTPTQIEETVVSESDWTRGNPEAQTVLVYYFDLQCPACAAYTSQLDQALENHPDNLLIVYRHFPLEGTHAHALSAAQTLEAAGKQDKFWEMYNVLIQNQEAWAAADDTSTLFRQYAQSLRLDTAQLAKDTNSDSVKNKIAADQALGRGQGVISVPGFILNNQTLPYPDSFEAFQQTISTAVGQAQ